MYDISLVGQKKNSTEIFLTLEFSYLQQKGYFITFTYCHVMVCHVTFLAYTSTFKYDYKNKQNRT